MSLIFEKDSKFKFKYKKYSSKDVESIPRKSAFSHWETLYDNNNRVTEEKKN